MESPDRSDADDAFDSEPTIGGRTYPVIAGRLSASVAFTRQRNGVQNVLPTMRQEAVMFTEV